jgi:hypothetical protein
MTERELNKSLSERLRSAGLAPYLVREKGQVLELPDGFFAEIVLSDASKLEEASAVVAAVRAEVEHQGAHLTPIVRAIWSVKQVESVGPARGASGGAKSSVDFRAVLESGSRETEAIVEVGGHARDKLRREREKFGSDVQVVTDFLRLQLSFGGAMHWDPVRYPRQELNEAALAYLLAHRPVAAA